MESYGYQLLKVVASLLVVLGLMGGVMAVLKFFMQKRGNGGAGRLPVKILGRGFIGYKKDIVVVDVAGETLILGITADSIVCLGRLEDRAAVERFKKGEKTENNPLIERILSKLNEPAIKRKRATG